MNASHKAASERSEDVPAKPREEEALKLYFEYFKHFTTLGTAAATVILVVFTPNQLRSFPGAGASPSEVFVAAATSASVRLALVLFGFALGFSLIGMTVTTINFDSPTEATHKWLRRLVILVALFTGIAVWTFLGAAFGLRMRYFLAIALLLFVVVYHARRGDLRPRIPRNREEWSRVLSLWLKTAIFVAVGLLIVGGFSIVLSLLF